MYYNTHPHTNDPRVWKANKKKMSLGYNSQVRLRVTNLSGGTNHGISFNRNRPRFGNRSSIEKEAVTIPRAPPPSRAAPPPSPRALTEEAAPVARAPARLATPSPRKEEETVGGEHWVYGTASGDLVDHETKEVVCKDGGRVLLLYPMREEGGNVLMRMKAVDPVTAQLSMHWVKVYDAEDDVRHVTHFAA